MQPLFYFDHSLLLHGPTLLNSARETWLPVGSTNPLSISLDTYFLVPRSQPFPPMSTAPPPVYYSGVSLGYGIAVAVSILVFISTIMLASYACIRVKSGGGREESNHRSLEPIMLVLGQEKRILESYPSIVLGESRRLPKPNNGPCSICLSEYCAKDTLRCIPDCNHCFHATCVDEWLQVNASCPLCRNSPAPSTIPTPLSEFVPLAYHSR